MVHRVSRRRGRRRRSRSLAEEGGNASSRSSRASFKFSITCVKFVLCCLNSVKIFIEKKTEWTHHHMSSHFKLTYPSVVQCCIPSLLFLSRRLRLLSCQTSFASKICGEEYVARGVQGQVIIAKRKAGRRNVSITSMKWASGDGRIKTYPIRGEEPFRSSISASALIRRFYCILWRNSCIAYAHICFHGRCLPSWFYALEDCFRPGT
ncbi:hypothetical protein SCHPADRAFT_532449 [Schizopora paradoxa]|uniref:Uncharacterized protein n=1 Tax=Schizopora paradoxa TaxID=27342 RepID=A0A0H2RZG5_9AGAM|nr:hypothetical protein SCHPADRAFT_532449 [Schizopora paradoxa]